MLSILDIKNTKTFSLSEYGNSLQIEENMDKYETKIHEKPLFL